MINYVRKNVQKLIILLITNVLNAKVNLEINAMIVMKVAV